MIKIVLAVLALISLQGCLYKMPTERNISTLPNINNPTHTHERPRSLIPGQG